VLEGLAPWSVVQADVLDFLAGLPPDSVSLVLGSPPYSQARLYLESGEDLGIARDTEEWVRWMVEVYRACLRVCTGLVAFVVDDQTRDYSYGGGPFLLAADLLRAGVTLRKPCVYRRVGIPGSGGPDWLRNDWEPVLVAARGGRLPWSDNTVMGHPPLWGPGGEMSHRTTSGRRVNQRGGTRTSTSRGKDGTMQAPGRPSHRYADEAPATEPGLFGPVEAPGPEWVKTGTFGLEDGTRGRQNYRPPVLANPGNVIDCLTGGGQMGSLLCHENEAPYAEHLAEFFVRSFAAPGSVVCDPFSGSGTTGAVAVRWGRRFVGCDIRGSQLELSRRRIASVTPDLFPTS
jgi:hypothetical protein